MKTTKLYLIVVCIFFIVFNNAIKVFAVDTPKEIDISLSASKVFFNTANLKPGDIVVENLRISNNGKQNFNYLFSNKFLTGSEKLYNELKLKIIGNNNELYNGKLKDFEKLDPRFLTSGSSEQLVFYVEIPYELGNEFQGLGCEFQFKFFVEGSLNGTIPPGWVPEADPPKQDPPKQDPPKQDPPKQEPPSTQPPGDKEPDAGKGPGDGDDEENGENPGDPGSEDGDEPSTVELPDNEGPGGDNGTPVIEIPEETVPIGPGDPDDQGDPLPYTATSMYNLIIIGVGLIGSGLGLQFYFQRRKKLTKDV
ncbi:hypothetical protein [Neobacillus sp. YIM B06451]|uniref:hypothetical protein n=1 Tax=Neobacillus sp. YIM B06451 TaxID=3070994 RepID=UPI0029309A7D|nr:hypothetical protein [Neobacillus sp. YIM B06451]